MRGLYWSCALTLSCGNAVFDVSVRFGQMWSQGHFKGLCSSVLMRLMPGSTFVHVQAPDSATCVCVMVLLDTFAPCCLSSKLVLAVHASCASAESLSCGTSTQQVACTSFASCIEACHARAVWDHSHFADVRTCISALGQCLCCVGLMSG